MPNLDSLLRNRLARGALVGAGAFLLAIALHSLKAARPLEWKSWDLRLHLFAEPARASRDIVILLIDQYSLDVYEEQQGLSWPWPRQLYSAVTDYLRTGGARAVFFDLVFSEGSRAGVEDDEDFALVMERAGNVFLPLSMSGTEESFEATPPGTLERFSISGEGARGARFPEARSVSLPVDTLLRAAKGAGNVSFVPDGDGVFRRLPIAFAYQGTLIPAVPLALARFLGSGESLGRLPLDGSGRLIIRYYGPSATYTTYSIAAIINSWARIESGLEPQIAPAEFAGKTVLIGGSAAGILDFRPTPLSAVYPGVEIQATVLDNLLRGDFIRPQKPAVFIALLFVFSLLTAVGASLLRKMWLQVPFFLFALALPCAAAWLAFATGCWLELAVPIFGVLTAFIGSALLNYSIEGKQRRFIKGVFRHYLSPDVIDRIIRQPSLLRLGGEKREITSFFSDVAGFTSISEVLSPEDLVNLLNEYLSEMTEIILASGGTLDKYEGDAIIAFWNAPLDQPDHALRACRAALQCRKRLAELGPNFSEKIGRPLTMRIGLNSGPAVVGNMGSSRRFDYTAMGDTVNLASRLEGAAKLYGVTILVGEETHARVGEAVVVREVDTIRVVGKAKPVSVYEVVGERGEVAAPEMDKLKLFERAREAYKRRDWDGAIDLFTGLKGDGAAEIYLGRCRDLKASPPRADWDGVFELTHK